MASARGAAMSFVRELPPFPFDLVVGNSDLAYLFENQWLPCTGVPALDLLADVRNVVLGTSAAVAIKPAILLAATRTVRPDDWSLVGGSAITANRLYKFAESLSAATKFFVRRGIGYQLTAGSFARARGILYTSYRSTGVIGAAEEIVFNPTNDVALASYFPLGGGKAQPADGVTHAKAVVFGMGSLNTKLEWRLAARLFNDPLARGAWNDLGAGWNNPQNADFDLNTGELALSGLSPANYQWIELALAVRKQADGDTNSRCVFRVIPALKYGT